MSRVWWVTFNGKGSACYEGTQEEVSARAAADGNVRTMKWLPYPADPRTEPKGECPSFCYTPAKCQGYTSCPKPYACSE